MPWRLDSGPPDGLRRDRRPLPPLGGAGGDGCKPLVGQAMVRRKTLRMWQLAVSPPSSRGVLSSWGTVRTPLAHETGARRLVVEPGQVRPTPSPQSAEPSPDAVEPSPKLAEPGPACSTPPHHGLLVESGRRQSKVGRTTRHFTQLAQPNPNSSDRIGPAWSNVVRIVATTQMRSGKQGTFRW